jgi:hypothetical protein
MGHCRAWRAACNLHTALELVAKMRGLGIQARCDTLVMQPTLAMQRRKQRRFQQQARCASQAAIDRCALLLRRVNPRYWRRRVNPRYRRRRHLLT